VRIAHVSDCYAPRTGGIESQVAALAQRQVAAGRDIRVITATPGRHVRSGIDTVDGVPVHRITAHLPADLPIHPRTRRAVVGVLRSDPVDIVHVHAGVISPFAWGAVRAARELGIPVLVTVHSVWGAMSSPVFRASDALARWSSWGVTLSAVSTLAAQRVQRAVPQGAPVLVIPNGIDPEQWRVPRREVSAERMHVVTVMRLAPRKRALPWVRMVALARQGLHGQVDLTATVVGDGPMRERAQRLARSLGLADALEFTGRLDRAGVLQELGRADAYVQPSVKESFGLAALEARASGLPVIVRAQSGSTEFIHDGVEGLVASDDPGMVAALVRLGLDPGLRQRIADHNESTPPDESWANVLDIVDDAYASAVERAGAR